MDAISLLANACTSAVTAIIGSPQPPATTPEAGQETVINGQSASGLGSVIGTGSGSDSEGKGLPPNTTPRPTHHEAAPLSAASNPASASVTSNAVTPSTASSSKSSSRGNWTAEEDELLRSAVDHYGGRNWKKISEQIPDRTDVQCLHRWQKVLRPGLVKGPWTPEVWFLCRKQLAVTVQ